MLRSRTKHPPGGFQFFQVETGWHVPDGKGFDAVVDAVIAHRQANSKLDGQSTVRHTVETQVDLFNCERLGNDPRWVDTQKKTVSQTQPASRLVIEPLVKSPTPFPAETVAAKKRSAPHAVKPVSVWEQVKQIANGAKILVEWLGKGGEPVSKALAEKRSITCVSCPLNDPTDKRTAAKAMAKKIADHLRVKHGLGMKVSNESLIDTCLACNCHLPLKVWVPLEHIDTTPKDLKKLDPGCWIRAEVLANA